MNTRSSLLGFFLEKIECGDSRWRDQLDEYFTGKRTEFDLEYGDLGSEFQRAVLMAMCEIPYGETRSYGWVAEKAGYPRAYRAVGSACNKNKMPVIIPCHRVVASGGIGGYAYGLEVKKSLIDFEKRVIGKI